MLRPPDYLKAMLLNAAWFEAASDGLKPMQMVAQCIGNRVRLGWGTWSAVLSNLANYSAMDADLRAACLLAYNLPDPSAPLFNPLLASIDGIYDNTFEDLTRGGLYWARLDAISRPWFMEEIMHAKDKSGNPLHHRVSQQGTFVVWD